MAGSAVRVVPRHRALPSACGLAAVTALFWANRIAWPRRPLPITTTDVWVYFYPTYEAFYARLRAGVVPLWNPYLLCGLPWIGTLQGGFFYPPHVLYLLLPTYAALAASGVLPAAAQTTS